MKGGASDPSIAGGEGGIGPRDPRTMDEIIASSKPYGEEWSEEKHGHMREPPKNPGGANPVEGTPPPKSFGAPIGGPPEVSPEREAEREKKETQKPKPGEASAAIEEHIQEGIDETLRADLEANADRRTGAAEESPTEDLSAMGAGKKILQRRNPETPGR